jgi:hypothetical protein
LHVDDAARFDARRSVAFETRLRLATASVCSQKPIATMAILHEPVISFVVSG